MATPPPTTPPAPSPPVAPHGDFVTSFPAEAIASATTSHGVSAAAGEAGSGYAAVRLTGGEPGAPSGGTVAGFSVRLPDELETKASGGAVEVAVVARAIGAPRAAFAVAYSTNEVGNSGWRAFEAGPAWAEHRFRYAVPPMKAGRGDFVGVLPGEGTIELAFLAVSVTPAA